MALRLGSSTPSKLYLGATEVTKAYLGASEVYSSAPAAWTPADLGASLALWLDADDASTITLNGSDVSQWNDKSGNNRHAVQATAANQPAYSATEFNGKPAVVWPNASNPMRLDVPAFAAQSFYFAIRYGDGTQTGWITGNQGVFGGIANVNNATGSNVGLIGGNANLSNWFNSNPFNSGRYNGGAQVTLGSGLTTLPLPATVFEASHPTGAQTPALAWQIGLDRNVATRGWSGPIAEIIATPALLSDTDRQKLEGYLAWKWGGI